VPATTAFAPAAAHAFADSGLTPPSHMMSMSGKRSRSARTWGAAGGGRTAGGGGEGPGWGGSVGCAGCIAHAGWGGLAALGAAARRIRATHTHSPRRSRRRGQLRYGRAGKRQRRRQHQAAGRKTTGRRTPRSHSAHLVHDLRLELLPAKARRDCHAQHHVHVAARHKLAHLQRGGWGRRGPAPPLRPSCCCPAAPQQQPPAVRPAVLALPAGQRA
jgi:hypothetical protein